MQRFMFPGEDEFEAFRAALENRCCNHLANQVEQATSSMPVAFDIVPT